MPQTQNPSHRTYSDYVPFFSYAPEPSTPYSVPISTEPRGAGAGQVLLGPAQPVRAPAEGVNIGFGEPQRNVIEQIRGGPISLGPTRRDRPAPVSPGSRPSAGGPSRAGGLGLMMSSESPLEPQSFLTEMEPFLPWQRSGPLSLSGNSLLSIQLLARTIFAEASGESRRAMEAVGWAIRNRVESGRRDFPSRTYEGIIFQTKHGRQYTSVGSPEWRKAGNPLALSNPDDIAAYARALTVAVGVYYGAIPDPLGALHFHSGPPTRDFRERLQKGWIRPALPRPIGPFTFYK